MNPPPTQSSAPDPPARKRRRSFGEDFTRFFVRGLGTLLPTIITVWLIWSAFDFLWDSLGKWIIYAIGRGWCWRRGS